MIARLLQMGWRNLRRNRRRTGLTIAALAGGLGFTSWGWVLTLGMIGTMVDSVAGGGDGHVLLEPPGQLEEPNLFDTLPDTPSVLAHLDAAPGVLVASPRVAAGGLLSTGEHSTGTQVLGIDPARYTALLSPGLTALEGRFVEAPGEVALGLELARQLHVSLGEEVFFLTQAADGSMGNAAWKVVGLMDTGSTLRNRTASWVSMEEAQTVLVLNGAHGIALSLEKDVDASEFAASLAGQDGWTTVPTDAPGNETLEEGPEDTVEEGIEPHRTPLDPEATVVARSWRSLNPIIAQYQSMSTVWMAIMVGLILATAAMGAMNTMLMSVMERTRELGILMAVGMKPRHVVVVVVAESVALAGIAILAGLALGGALSWHAVEVGLDFSTSYGEMDFAGVTMQPSFHGAWAAVAFWMPAALLMVVTLLASFLPAVRAARLRPVDAMRRV